MKYALYTGRVEVISSYNERRDCADQRIASFIRACGLLPIPLPNMADMAGTYIEELRPAIIILTGGNSLVSCGGNAPERDDMDEALINEAVRRGLPLYGFCRGMQSILAHFGCALSNVAGHVAVRHEISYLADGSSGIAAGERRLVNSYHNQAAAALPAGCELEAVAVCAGDMAGEQGQSADNGQSAVSAQSATIEAVRHKTLPIIGTMWHPEREAAFDAADIDMVTKLLDKGAGR